MLPDLLRRFLQMAKNKPEALQAQAVDNMLFALSSFRRLEPLASSEMKTATAMMSECLGNMSQASAQRSLHSSALLGSQEQSPEISSRLLQCATVSPKEVSCNDLVRMLWSIAVLDIHCYDQDGVAKALGRIESVLPEIPAKIRCLQDLDCVLTPHGHGSLPVRGTNLRKLVMFAVSCETDSGLASLLPPRLAALRVALGEGCGHQLLDEENGARTTPNDRPTLGSLERQAQHSQIADALRTLFPSLSVEEKVRDARSGYTLELLLQNAPTDVNGGKSQKVVVDFASQDRFLKRTCFPRGWTLLRERQLRQLGYRIVTVPYWEWHMCEMELNDESSTMATRLQMAYLGAVMRMHLADSDAELEPSPLLYRLRRRVAESRVLWCACHSVPQSSEQPQFGFRSASPIPFRAETRGRFRAFGTWADRQRNNRRGLSGSSVGNCSSSTGLLRRSSTLWMVMAVGVVGAAALAVFRLGRELEGAIDRPAAVDQAHHACSGLPAPTGSRLKNIVAAGFRLARHVIVFLPLLLVYLPMALFGSGALDKWWCWLLGAIESSGPALIKFAQWAATRTDMFPAQLCRRFAQLQDGSRSHPLAAQERAIADLFEASEAEGFRLISIEEAPVGSGCIAQVHRGVIATAGGEQCVAIKVLHPGVLATAQLDVDLLRALGDLVEVLPPLHWLSLRESVEEFSDLIGKQMDLRHEAANLERFAANFGSWDDIFFPRPVRPLVSREVLVETYEHGIPLREWIKGEPAPRIPYLSSVLLLSCSPGHSEDAQIHFLSCCPWTGPRAEEEETKRALARIGVKSFLHMCFRHNFIHGDLHPGNILVNVAPDGADGKAPVSLTLLDAGITTELTERDRRNFRALFAAIVEGDGRKAGRLMVDNARAHACEDPEAFCAAIGRLVDGALATNLSLGRIQAGRLLAEAFALACTHQVKIESNFASVCLAIMVLEGVGRNLDPDLNVLRAAAPILLTSVAQSPLLEK